MSNLRDEIAKIYEAEFAWSVKHNKTVRFHTMTNQTINLIVSYLPKRKQSNFGSGGSDNWAKYSEIKGYNTAISEVKELLNGK